MTDSTYWAEGRTTSDILILSNSIDDLVAGIVDGYDSTRGTSSYASLAEGPERLARRESWFVELAGDLQAGFIKNGLMNNEFTWSGLLSDEIARLNRAKDFEDSGEPWHARLPLVLVRAPFPAIRGDVVYLDPRTARTFLNSLRRCSMLSSYGPLTAPARVEDPTRLPE